MIYVVRGFLLLALDLGKFGHHSDNLLIPNDSSSWNKSLIHLGVTHSRIDLIMCDLRWRSHIIAVEFCHASHIE